MGYYTTAEIVKIVNKLIDRCGTRDPYKVAKELGINIIYRNFDKQRGAYKVILKNRFVFLKNGMHPVVDTKCKTVKSRMRSDGLILFALSMRYKVTTYFVSLPFPKHSFILFILRFQLRYWAIQTRTKITTKMPT